MNNEKKPLKNNIKIIVVVVVIIAAIAGFFGLKFYSLYFSPNIRTNKSYIYVKTGADYNGFLHDLLESGVIKNEESFKEAADKMNLAKNIKPGRYAVKEGMNNRTLINKLKAGNQDAVKLKFQNIRKKENFAAYLAKNMEADSLAFIKVLDSAALVE
ncbi:MAG: endolytic transglycosylase MltG, partial [Pedobacter sp.]|uniref:endolytic transglycosylase MltG n=1 Tax=Pedobacter sp. TaxID=1411316 RepID=UPI003565EB13